MPNKFEQFDDFDLPISVGEFEDEDTREISPSDLATLKESAHMEEGSLPPNLAGEMEMESTDILPMSALKTNATGRPGATRDAENEALANTILVPGVGKKEDVYFSELGRLITPPDNTPAYKKDEPTNVLKMLDIKSEHISEDGLLSTGPLSESIGIKIHKIFTDFFQGSDKRTIEDKLYAEVFGELKSYVAQESNVKNLKNLLEMMNQKLSRHYEKKNGKTKELCAFHLMVTQKFGEMVSICTKRIGELEPIDEKANRISSAWRARNLGDTLFDVTLIEPYPVLGLNEYERHVIFDACVIKHADQLLRFGKSIEAASDIVYFSALKTAELFPESDPFRFFLFDCKAKIVVILNRLIAKLQEERKSHKQNACGMKRDSQPDSKKESVYMTGVKKIEKKPSKAKSWFSKAMATAGLLATMFVAGAISKKSSDENEEKSAISLTEDLKPEDAEKTKSDACLQAEYLVSRANESAMELAIAEEEPVIVDALEEDGFVMVDAVSEENYTIANSTMEEDFDFSMTDEVSEENNEEAMNSFVSGEIDGFVMVDAEEESFPEAKLLVDFPVQKTEIKTGDTMWGFMKDFKANMKMDKVRNPEYFDDFNDWDVLTALAIFSDEEAKRVGDENYKKISGDLNLRRGRNFYFTEDAGEILFILTRPDFREKAESAQGSYEGWRTPNQNSENELSSLEKAEVKNAENEDSSVNTIEIDDEWEERMLEDESLIPIDIDNEWEKMAQDEALIPIEVDDEAENMAENEALIPIDIDNEWEKMAQDEALIPIEVDDEAENMAENEALIPIDIDNEWEKMAQDEALIPIDIDDEWVKMLEGGAEKVVEDTKKKVENVLTFEEIDAEWDEMDEDAELEMALNAMIK